MQQPLIVKLDADRVRRLGSLFERARSERQLTVEEVAKALLLSKAQVRGLESGIQKSFYSARIYVLAAQKYAAYLELDFGLSELLDSADAVIGGAATTSQGGGSTATEMPCRSTDRLWSQGKYVSRNSLLWLLVGVATLLGLIQLKPLAASGFPSSVPQAQATMPVVTHENSLSDQSSNRVEKVAAQSDIDVSSMTKGHAFGRSLKSEGLY